MEKSALVYIILTVVTVAFGFLVKNRDYTTEYLSGRRSFRGNTSGDLMAAGPDRQQACNAVAEFAIFCLLAGVSACRIAVGGDYWVYWLKFQLIDQGRHVSYETGFVYLVKFFHLIFGEGSYLPIFGFFSLITVFFFLKALHDQADWYVFSLFLLLTQGFYFNSMNSVRYYFALALVMYAQKYVLRGEYGKFLLWVLLGCTIHKSVLLVIPAYIVIDLLSRIRLKKWHYAVGVLLILSLIFGQDVYRNIIFRFYPYYKDSMFDNGQLSYVNIAKCTVPDLLEGQRSGKSQKPLLLLSESGGTGALFLRLLYPGSIPSGILPDPKPDFPDSGCAEGCQKGMVPNPVYYWRCCSISIVFRNAAAGNV